MTLYVAPIVEGQTEQGCVDRLLHRVWGDLLKRPERLQVIEAFRGHRDQLIHLNGAVLTETVRKAFLQMKAKSRRDTDASLLVLILLDAEQDCPATLAPRLVKTAVESLAPGAVISCVLAKQMLENWIVGGACSLASINGLPNAIPLRTDVENLRGSSWLERQLRLVDRTRSYRKTIDAKEFVQRLDLHECRTNCPSFDKLCRELQARVPTLGPIAELKNPEDQAQLEPGS